jgi:hypothetical protein
MATSAFEEPLVTGSGSKLTEGEKYVVELTDIVSQKKVVTFREALRGKKTADGKSIIGKEYDSLPADMKALVDNTPEEYWPLRDGETEQRAKNKFTDRIVFQFREPTTDVKFLFDAQFDVPSKKLREFVERSTGMVVKGDEGYTWGNLYKKGDKFIATIIKRGNFLGIDTDSIVKEALHGPLESAGSASGELSPTAQKLLEYIKGNMIGKPKSAVFDLFDTGQFGTYAETQKAWTEIQKKTKVSLDGKTFGFE